MTDLERNERTVIAFHEMMSNACDPRAAVARFVGADHDQHNPHVVDGKDGLVDSFERMAREWPGRRVEVRRALAEGRFVVLHCHQHRPGDRDHAGIDVFRLDDDGRIVEHRDVLQPLPERSANANGMF